MFWLNFFLNTSAHLQIADFGLSNVFDEQRLLGTFCGSPLYASPEIVKGTPYHGPEVDCWYANFILSKSYLILFRYICEWKLVKSFYLTAKQKTHCLAVLNYLLIYVYNLAYYLKQFYMKLINTIIKPQP